MHDSQHPGSRRSSGKLSQVAVLREALAIADADGLENLTMRKLAARLDSAPMSIYRYFPSKAAIEARLLDFVIGATLATDHDEPALRDWMRVTFRKIRRTLLDHPGVLPLLGTSASFGPHAMRALDEVLERMRRQGLEPADAAHTLQILINYTLGAVVMECGMRQGIEPAPDAPIGSEGSRLPRQDDFPHVRELADTLEQRSPDAVFEEGLERVLDLASPDRAMRTSTMRPARSG